MMAGRVHLAAGLVALALAGCTPEPVAFPMPDTWANEEYGVEVEALGCPAAEEAADGLEPDGEEWLQAYNLALRASATRTVLAEPQLLDRWHRLDTDATAERRANPFGLPADEFAAVSNQATWDAVCAVEDFDRATFDDFTVEVFGNPRDEAALTWDDGPAFLALSGVVQRMIEPHLEPFEE